MQADPVLKYVAILRPSSFLGSKYGFNNEATTVTVYKPCDQILTPVRHRLAPRHIRPHTSCRGGRRAHVHAQLSLQISFLSQCFHIANTSH